MTEHTIPANYAQKPLNDTLLPSQTITEELLSSVDRAEDIIRKHKKPSASEKKQIMRAFDKMAREIYKFDDLLRGIMDRD